MTFFRHASVEMNDISYAVSRTYKLNMNSASVGPKGSSLFYFKKWQMEYKGISKTPKCRAEDKNNPWDITL